MIEIRKKIVGLKIIELIIFLLITIFIAIFLSKYLTNNDFRENINSKIFNKEIEREKLNCIEIDSEDNLHIYSFSNYIAILDKKELNLYTKTAEKYMTLEINLINPIAFSNNEYLALADNGGSRIYLINEFGIIWEHNVDGNIYDITVNENGYVSVLIENATFDSIALVYDSNGTELFRNYSAMSFTLCARISNNNKLLSIGEIDYSGTVVKSVVKLISIEMATTTPKDAVVNTYESQSGQILINTEFNSKNELICIFNSYIVKITELASEKIYDITSNDLLVDIGLKNNIIIAQKESTGLFSYEYQVLLKNTIGKSDSLYILEKDFPKKVITSGDFFCINLSNEIKIVNSNGLLLKKYTITKEIKDIVIGKDIIGLIYNNKIEIINL